MCELYHIQQKMLRNTLKFLLLLGLANFAGQHKVMVDAAPVDIIPQSRVKRFTSASNYLVNNSWLHNFLMFEYLQDKEERAEEKAKKAAEDVAPVNDDSANNDSDNQNTKQEEEQPNLEKTLNQLTTSINDEDTLQEIIALRARVAALEMGITNEENHDIHEEIDRRLEQVETVLYGHMHELDDKLIISSTNLASADVDVNTLILKVDDTLAGIRQKVTNLQKKLVEQGLEI